MTHLNLFVPEDAPGYDDVLAYVEGVAPCDYHYERHRLCHDMRRASGYWVPHTWWDSRLAKRIVKAQKKAAPASATLELADIQLSAEALALIQKEDQ